MHLLCIISISISLLPILSMARTSPALPHTLSCAQLANFAQSYKDLINILNNNNCAKTPPKDSNPNPSALHARQGTDYPAVIVCTVIVALFGSGDDGDGYGESRPTISATIPGSVSNAQDLVARQDGNGGLLLALIEPIGEILRTLLGCGDDAAPPWVPVVGVAMPVQTAVF
ncbi:hypothetical protein BDW59DRAFT_167718 [Aspergillus cavernicola]|uniref:Hydrophobin n=1 Tax=Aspergillus cavernicola TaxID=176166 RepID=A0ABR4HBE2_9EURO